MHIPGIDQLFIRYQAQSHSRLSHEEFLSLVTFFPGILVIAVDGVIDQEEWVFVNHIVKAMASGYREHYRSAAERQELEKRFMDDVKFLIKHLDYWQHPFIEALAEYLRELPDIKEEVREVIYMFADASDDISSKEKALIERLEAELLLIDSDNSGIVPGNSALPHSEEPFLPDSVSEHLIVNLMQDSHEPPIPPDEPEKHSPQ